MKAFAQTNKGLGHLGLFYYQSLPSPSNFACIHPHAYFWLHDIPHLDFYHAFFLQRFHIPRLHVVMFQSEKSLYANPFVNYVEQIKIFQ